MRFLNKLMISWKCCGWAGGSIVGFWAVMSWARWQEQDYRSGAIGTVEEGIRWTTRLTGLSTGLIVAYGVNSFANAMYNGELFQLIYLAREEEDSSFELQTGLAEDSCCSGLSTDVL